MSANGTLTAMMEEHVAKENSLLKPLLDRLEQQNKMLMDLMSRIGQLEWELKQRQQEPPVQWAPAISSGSYGATSVFPTLQWKDRHGNMQDVPVKENHL